MTKKIILAASIMAIGVLIMGAILMVGSNTAEAAKAPGTGITCVDRGWRCDIEPNGSVSCGPVLVCDLNPAN